MREFSSSTRRMSWTPLYFKPLKGKRLHFQLVRPLNTGVYDVNDPKGEKAYTAQGNSSKPWLIHYQGKSLLVWSRGVRCDPPVRKDPRSGTRRAMNHQRAMPVLCYRLYGDTLGYRTSSSYCYFKRAKCFMELLIKRMALKAAKLRRIRLSQPYVSPQAAKAQVERVARVSARRSSTY
jgi:hypothetical protein